MMMVYFSQDSHYVLMLLGENKCTVRFTIVTDDELYAAYYLAVLLL